MADDGCPSIDLMCSDLHPEIASPKRRPLSPVEQADLGSKTPSSSSGKLRLYQPRHPTTINK